MAKLLCRIDGNLKRRLRQALCAETEVVCGTGHGVNIRPAFSVQDYLCDYDVGLAGNDRIDKLELADIRI